MRKGLRTIGAAVALGLAGQGPAAGQETSFPATTEVVSVDVLVLDDKGQPVEGLTAADFKLSEDGQPQVVASFEAVRVGGTASTSVARWRVSSNRAPAGAPERAFVVVFDDLNLSPFTLQAARNAVRTLLTSGLRDGDVVTLAPTSSRASWTGRLPDGREGLLRFLDRLESRFRPDSSSARISDYEALQIHSGRDPNVLPIVLRRYMENGILQEPLAKTPEARESLRSLDINPGAQIVRARANEVYLAFTERLKQTLGTLERTAQALGHLKGRKTILFVSEGFVYDSTQTGFRDVTRAARAANAAFYFVDARGLQAAGATPGGPGSTAEHGRLGLGQDVLSTFTNEAREAEGAVSVAADTGGFSIRNTNNLAERMRAVAEESRAYYLIGYVPGNTRRDGKFRKIEVQVARPGVSVRARRGYFAPSESEPRAAGRNTLDPRVRAALDTPIGAGELELRLVGHGFGPVAGGKSAALLVAEVGLKGVTLKAAAGQHSGVLETYVVLTGRDNGEHVTQEKLVELNVPEAALPGLLAEGLSIYRDFQLAPGAYQARLLVRDRESGRLASVRHEFSVPDPNAFTTSVPVLTDRVQPEGPQGPARPVPVAHRVFASGRQLVYAYEVYGAKSAPGGARVSAAYEVRRADGSTLVRRDAQPLAPGPQGQIAHLLPISLQGVAAGDYELVVTVSDDVAGQRLEISDAFSVVGPAGS